MRQRGLSAWDQRWELRVLSQPLASRQLSSKIFLARQTRIIAQLLVIAQNQFQGHKFGDKFCISMHHLFFCFQFSLYKGDFISVHKFIDQCCLSNGERFDDSAQKCCSRQSMPQPDNQLINLADYCRQICRQIPISICHMLHTHTAR